MFSKNRSRAVALAMLFGCVAATRVAKALPITIIASEVPTQATVIMTGLDFLYQGL